MFTIKTDEHRESRTKTLRDSVSMATMAKKKNLKRVIKVLSIMNVIMIKITHMK